MLASGWCCWSACALSLATAAWRHRAHSARSTGRQGSHPSGRSSAVHTCELTGLRLRDLHFPHSPISLTSELIRYNFAY